MAYGVLLSNTGALRSKARRQRKSPSCSYNHQHPPKILTLALHSLKIRSHVLLLASPQSIGGCRGRPVPTDKPRATSCCPFVLLSSASPSTTRCLRLCPTAPLRWAPGCGLLAWMWCLCPGFHWSLLILSENKTSNAVTNPNLKGQNVSETWFMHSEP